MQADLIALAERLEAATNPRVLRFGVFSGAGWVMSSSEATVRLICDLWNNREIIAASLRARAVQKGDE